MPVHDSTYSRRSVLRLGALAAGATAGAVALAGGAAAAPPAVPAAFVPTRPPVSRGFLRSLDRSTTLDGWAAEPFSMSDVTLAPSVATRSQDQMLHLARVYPVDRVLAVFRRNAGLDTKGASAPGGWEGFGHANEQAWGPDDYPGRANTQTANLLRGHYGGHFLSMVSLAFASTGETVFQDKVDQIVAGLGEVQTALAAMGRFSHPGFLAAYGEWQFSQLEKYAPYGEIWAPYYTCHKIMAGLLEAYRLAGSDQALEIATSMADWVHSRLSVLPQAQLDRMWGIYIAGEYGGMNEVLADLAAVTGDDTYVATARLFDLNTLVDASAAGTDTLNGKHANQHIPQFPGYLKVHDLTGEQRYLDAVEGFWGMVVPGRTYAHGGHGEGELFGPPNTVAGDIGARNAETCGTYNMLKLSRLLFFHTLDPKYMEYYERGLLNQIVGSKKNTQSDTNPDVTYMYGVNPGTRREYGNTGTCCGGTGLENHVKYRDSIYFRTVDGSALYVNLYLASTLAWEEKGFEVVQETQYPKVGSSRLTVTGSGQLDLRLRVPGWVRKGFTVRVNGAVQDLDAVPGTYVSVSRSWLPGDVVEIDMPLSIRAVPTIDNPAIQSIEHGPTVLLARSASREYLKLSLYAHMGLDGTLEGAFTDLGDGYFRLGTTTFEPAWSGDDTQYHMYVERSEPRVVFAGLDSGVTNAQRANGTSFLDVVWGDGGFADRAAFLAKVQRTVEQFTADGLLSRRDGQRVLVTAGKARLA
ncbi:beta-L-arabinofuranosidase domain-containing protein [Cellulosimicrobium sp. PMB13]|uniref:glycoside hydrolase family 127 protein n=1 Tax=Cellulosimicrobium sp. PMB13 TaxID=3120158 RepID=UPI003F4BF42F